MTSEVFRVYDKHGHHLTSVAAADQDEALRLAREDYPEAVRSGPMVEDALIYALVRCLKGIGTGSTHDFGHRVWNAAEKRGLIRFENGGYVAS